MICDDAAEFVSALCDGETIPPFAARHIAHCPDCSARLHDYLALGVELRRVASVALADAAPARNWNQQQNRFATFWQKGWSSMRIPKLAFASLIAGVVVLASLIAVGSVRARTTGTAVLLNTAGPDGQVCDCPLSTEDSGHPACSWYGKVGLQHLAYKVQLLARDGNRLRIAIQTRTYESGTNLSSFTQDADPASQTREFWFEPGERLKVDVAQVGTLTLTGEWMDHMPVMIGSQDLIPNPNEVRFARPLLLKDGNIVGDLAGSIGAVFSTDDLDYASAFYIPEEGRFLISQLPMKGALQAHVAFNRLTFAEAGHSWELVNGAPLTRADHLWVLHQPDFRTTASGPDANHPSFGNQKLIQIEPNLWTPEDQSH